MATSLTCLRLAPRERAWLRSRGVAALRAWRALAGRAARNRRLAVLRGVARTRGSLAAVWDAWRLLARSRTVQLHLREIHRLQVGAPCWLDGPTGALSVVKGWPPG